MGVLSVTSRSAATSAPEHHPRRWRDELLADDCLRGALDYGAGDSNVVAVHAETIGYRVIDALHEHGLTITRKR